MARQQDVVLVGVAVVGLAVLVQAAAILASERTWMAGVGTEALLISIFPAAVFMYFVSQRNWRCLGAVGLAMAWALPIVVVTGLDFMAQWLLAATLVICLVLLIVGMPSQSIRLRVAQGVAVVLLTINAVLIFRPPFTSSGASPQSWHIVTMASLLLIALAVVHLLAWVDEYDRRPPVIRDPSLIGALKAQLTCPRCRLKQEVVCNRDASCIRCGLSMRLDMEEPRCRCGYLIYKLEADRCPECGRAVKQWASRQNGADHAPHTGT